MKGIEFPEATAKLQAPEGLENEVNALSVWRHPEYRATISKWQLSWKERLLCLYQGHVWLHVWGEGHPPIAIETDYPFYKAPPPPSWGIPIIVISSCILIGLLIWVYLL